MFWPDPEKMGEFIDSLTSDDILLSPSGPNEGYLAGAFRRGAEVYWINPARLADIFGKGKRISRSVPQNLLTLWQNQPEVFYRYLETDFQIAQLARAYAAWLATEKEVIALGNSISQALRREREEFRYFTPPKEQWVEEKVERAVLRFQGAARRGGIRLPKDIIEAYRAKLTKEIETYYEVCVRGSNKEIEAIQKKLKQLELANVSGLLAEQKKRVASLLKELPHRVFFEDLVGVGVKSKAGILVSIGNPLQFPNFPALSSYTGMRIVEGQAIRRANPIKPEDLRYSHTAHRVLCFDFGDKAHYFKGFFQDLYYAYKLHQYLIYWPLIELTQEIFEAWDKKEVEEFQVKKWIERLVKIAPDLPMIQRSKMLQKRIEEVVREPSWSNLRHLFSRSGDNLQMTPLRIEYQCKRLNGITLSRIVYYRWLEFLDHPLPLDEDFIYQEQCRTIGEKGDKYDHYVHLEYYRKKVKDLMAQGKTLPSEVMKKFPEF